MKIAAFSLSGQGSFAQDKPALAEAIKTSGADIVLLPGTSRVRRAIGAAALCILVTFSRAARPWVIVTDPSLFAEICAKAGVEPAALDPAPATSSRTKVNGLVAASGGGESTIKPDAKLLFVAGAGWTKKQADGATHLDEAASTITGFLAKSGASLGSSKSLVDMPEAAEAFKFMSHMNQVGQTGATPRHAKGLSTCCHGEEPHVVGWRFIGERRAVNLDANCGWAQGKADVLYVADAFEVMKKVNELL